MLKPNVPQAQNNGLDGDTMFSYERTVHWSDCDPANMVFTGKIPYFALDAIDSWWEEKVGDDWFRLNVDRNIGLPFVHISVDFKKPVTTRAKLICTVELIKLGSSSVRFHVVGKQNDELCFEGQFVEVFVQANTHTKISIPEPYKSLLVNELRT